MSIHPQPPTHTMSDDEQDALDALEREASDFNKARQFAPIVQTQLTQFRMQKSTASDEPSS